ncbi:MAG: hypothetical protein AB1610_06280 [Nitrospirota bacterium]
MKKSLALIICFIIIGTGIAFAEPFQRHTLELGAEISHITYREPDVMKEEGIMYGIAGSYAYRNNLMVKAECRGSYGQVDYSNSGKINNIDDYMVELRGLFGYDFFVSKSILTPYTGLGYRYLNDDSSGRISTTGAYGYERESNYIYSPLGIIITTPLENGWAIGITAEYDIFWWGKQISHLSDVDSGYNDVENEQNEGYGVRGSIKVYKRIKNMDIAIEPFIRYWHIMKSEIADWTYYGTYIGYAYEPENKSTEFGIKASITF